MSDGHHAPDRAAATPAAGKIPADPIEVAAALFDQLAASTRQRAVSLWGAASRGECDWREAARSGREALLAEHLARLVREYGAVLALAGLLPAPEGAR